MDNQQPSLALTYTMLTYGPDAQLGTIRTWATNFEPGGDVDAGGQIFRIQDHPILSSYLGTTYGGDGRTSFALPDLDGRVAVGAGEGPGLTDRPIGTQFGSDDVSLALDQYPHNLGGSSAPTNNSQASLAVDYIIATEGVFPSRSYGGGANLLGTVLPTAVPNSAALDQGWMYAHGQLLPIRDHQSLFSILGTTYGGDGITTFALPDLRGRVPIGVGEGPGLAPIRLGERLGSETFVVHQTNVPRTLDGGGQRIDNHQPSLGLNYIISLHGQFPSRNSLNSSENYIPYTGEVSLFAGNFAPRGYAFAHGQLLQIDQYSELFSLLGTHFGGDGRTTFALPDLRGTVVVGSGWPGGPVGSKSGSSDIHLQANHFNIPDTPVVSGFSEDTGVAGDGITSDGALEISGTSVANATIEVFRNGVSIGTTTADGSGNWTLDATGTDLAEGAHDFTAKATVNGAISLGSAALSVTIDKSAPTTPVITGVTDDTGNSATDGNTSDDTLTIRGTAAADATVDVYLGATKIGSATADNTGAWSFIYGTALAEGQHSFTAKNTDVAGNIATSTAFNVTVDTVIPVAASTPDLTAGSDSGSSDTDKITSQTRPVFTGTAEPGANIIVSTGSGQGLTSFAVSTLVEATGNWSITAPDPLADGTYTLTAEVIDLAGNRSPTSGALSFTIDTSAPAAPGTPDLEAGSDTGSSSTDDITSQTTQNLTGTAVAGSPVTLTSSIDGAVGTATADGNGNWSITSTALSEGTHSLTATAADVAGNTSAASAGLSVAVDTTSPVFDDGNQAAASVAENTRTVATIGATDAQPLTFTITGGTDQALFDLDAASGALEFKVAPDFEDPTKSADGDNEYQVTVTATDLAGLTATQDITVTVTDVDENAGGGGGVTPPGDGTQDPIEPNDPVTPNDPIEGTDTNDIITLDGLTGPVTVNGGDGDDTVVVEQPISEVAIGLSPDGYTFTTPDGLVITVDNVENIQFNDRSIMMDTSPEAKVVLFMYEVLLDRLMDLEGLSSWLGAFGGGASFGEIADGFLNSPEFVQSYGDLSNDAFVTLLYDSAFDRAPDQAGFDAWLAGLNDGTLTRGDVAAAFAQSTEMGNQFQSHLNDGVFVLV